MFRGYPDSIDFSFRFETTPNTVDRVRIKFLVQFSKNTNMALSSKGLKGREVGF